MQEYLNIIKQFLKKSPSRFKKIIFGAATIVLYHRVDTPKNDPLLLSVSPDNFRKQLTYLKNKYKIIHLSELVERIKNKKSLRNYLVITFDDGYLDNYQKALPILEELEVPATIFVVSGKINSKESFFWDKDMVIEDAGIPLELSILEKLSQSPFIEIGAHTVTHPRLSELMLDKQKEEIFNSKRQLETLLKKPIETFSYPFGADGDFNAQTEDLAKEAGFMCACANQPGYVYSNSNLYTLPRILVRDYNLKNLKRYSL